MHHMRNLELERQRKLWLANHKTPPNDMKSETPPSPPPTPGQPILPAHAIPEKAERDKYLKLARELTAQGVALRDLWNQRDTLLKDQEGIGSERAKLCNALHKQAPGDLQKRGSLEKSLEGVNYRHLIKQAEIEGCEAAVAEAEVALHTKYPLANATFDRLYRALETWTLDSDYQKLLALIHPTRLGLTPELPPHLQPFERPVSSAMYGAMSPPERARVRKDPDGEMFILQELLTFGLNPPELTVEEMAWKMALSARATVELKAFRLPTAWVRPLVDDAMQGGAKWSTMRRATMEDICKQTDLLCERANSILDRAGQASGFQVPKFKLGPDEEPLPKPDVPLAWTQPTVTYSSEEEIRREFVWQGPEESKLSEHMEAELRRVGKTRADLTPGYYDTLIHSEILQSQSERAKTELSGSRSVATS
jgi:hypothetical protein